MFQDKVIVITGGTGSLGKVLARRILSGEMGMPKKVIIFSRDEAKQHSMRLEYLHKKITTDEVIYDNFKRVLEFRIGDVRNYSDVCSVLKNANFVINAAALKQVPTCEYFPAEAVFTNCNGAENIVRVLQEHDYPVDTVVGVSTDKACKPINVMGMSKAIQERIFISSNVKVPHVNFVCVRYGNVLASRGSVVPLFHDQIQTGGPVTITTTDMTRFLLSINQAVDCIFAALKEGQRGEIYVPDVPSALITNIAKAMVGNKKIEIKVTGIRPGEKIHESLISEEEYPYARKRGDYYVVKSMLPELSDAKAQKAHLPFEKEFNSAHHILSYEDTVELLKTHNLLDFKAIEI